MIALWISAAAVPVNAFLVWVLMFGNLGFPATRPPRRRHRHDGHQHPDVRSGSPALIYVDRRFRRYHLLGRFWRPDWARFREIWRIGLPIALTLGFEVTIFNAGVFLMGIIGADQLAAHSIALQIASVAFMVPLGLGKAATVRVGLAFGAGDVAGIRRAGWTAFALAMVYAAGTAAAMLLAGRPIVGVFLDLNVPENLPVVEIAVWFLVFAGLFQFFDGGQAVALRHAAWPRRHARADDLRGDRLLGRRIACWRSSSRFGIALGRHRHLDRPLARPWRRLRPDDGALDTARPAPPDAEARATGDRRRIRARRKRAGRRSELDGVTRRAGGGT